MLHVLGAKCQLEFLLQSPFFTLFFLDSLLVSFAIIVFCLIRFVCLILLIISRFILFIDFREGCIFEGFLFFSNKNFLSCVGIESVYRHSELFMELDRNFLVGTDASLRLDNTWVIVGIGVRRQDRLAVPLLFFVLIRLFDDLSVFDFDHPFELDLALLVEYCSVRQHDFSRLFPHSLGVLAVDQLFFVDDFLGDLVFQVAGLFAAEFLVKLLEPVFLLRNKLVYCLNHLALCDLVFDFGILATISDLVIFVFFLHESIKVGVQVFLAAKNGIEVGSAGCWQ